MKHMAGVEPQEPLVDEVSPQQAAPKRHLVYDHKILTCFAAYLLYLFFSIVIMVPLSLVGLDRQVMQSVVSVVAAIVVLVVYALRFRGQFDGVAKWSRTGMMLGIPVLLFAVPNFVDMVDHVKGGQSFNALPICLLMALAPGVAEEVVFRVMPGANWLRVRCEKRDVITCALFTSLVFALAHGSNALLGAPVSTTIFQVCYAFCFGVACCAVFLRSGSLFPGVLIHTFVDFTAFLTMDLSQGGVMTEELVFDLSFYVTVVCSIAVLLWGLYLLRPAALDGVVDLWNKKWGRRPEVEDA